MRPVSNMVAGSFGRWLVALLCCAALAGCKVELYSRLTEQEANAMVVTLAGEGITASKDSVDDKGWNVSVDEARLGVALEVLRANGLPNDRFISMGDVFQKQGLVSTPSEERMRYIYAVSQELSSTLMKVEGVVAARVHVTVPANDPFRDAVRPSHAAVFIKHRPDVDLRLMAPTIKELVAHSIDGLSHDDVSLSLFEATRTPAHAGGSPRAATSTAGLAPVQPFAVAFAAVAALAILAGLLLRKRWQHWLRWISGTQRTPATPNARARAR